MQACIYNEYGDADRVKVGEMATPAPRAGEVLVRVHAASVTTADWRFRSATFPAGFRFAGRLMLGVLRPRNPVLGMDFAGVVEAVGAGVTRFRPGDRVFGSTSPNRRGAHAEYVVVDAEGAITHTPASLRDDAAAAVPFGANCALAFLRDIARVEPGQRVLVVGASGGVGIWAVQLARHLGAEVTAVCSGRNAELVRSLGAHHVVDYTTGSIAPEGAVYDVIFDTVGGTSFAACRPFLSARGVYLPLENDVGDIVEALLVSRSNGKKMLTKISGNTREGLETIASLIAAGVLEPVVDRVYPMAHIADAHRHVEGRHKRGSVVISMLGDSRHDP